MAFYVAIVCHCVELFLHWPHLAVSIMRLSVVYPSVSVSHLFSAIVNAVGQFGQYGTCSV